MKFRTTLIAALLLGLFGAYVYFIDYKRQEEKKVQEEASKKAWPVSWDKLLGLKIINTHGTFVLKKDEEIKGASDSGAAEKHQKWQIQEPRLTEADHAAINGLVNSLKNLNVEQVVSETSDNLQAFGLTKPGLKLEILLAETENPVPMLLIGDKSPIGDNSYALRQGEKKVLLLSSNLATVLNKDLFDLRQKQLFAVNQNDIEGLRIKKQGKVKLEITREGEQWKIIHPIQARAVEIKINKILNQLTGLRALTYMTEEADNVAKYGLAEPDWRIDLFLSPARTQASLLLSLLPNENINNMTYLYAKRDTKKAVVVIDKELIKEIEKDPQELRQKKVFPFKSWEVTKVELSWKGQDVTIERIGAGQWSITAPIAVNASSNTVSSLLTELSGLEGEKFFKRPTDEKKLAPYGLVHPVVRMTLYQDQEDAVVIEGEAENENNQPIPLGTFLLGQSPQDKEVFYASMEDDDTIYQVNKDFYNDTLPDNIESFRTRKVLEFYQYLVARIEYKGPKGRILLIKKDDSWNLKKPNSKMIMDSDVNDLLTALSNLKVDRFMDSPPEKLSAWGLAPAEQSIILKDEYDDVLGTVLFSGKGPEDEKGAFYVKGKEYTWIGSIKDEKKQEIIDKLTPFQN